MTRIVLGTTGMAISSFLLLLSPAAASLEESHVSNGQIVVTGTNTTKAAIAKFIAATIANPKGGKHVGQYARFSQAVCPKVIGLSQASERQIEARMRGVALAADMNVAKERCAPNVYVIVVANGKEVVSMLRKKRSRLFGSVSHPERQRISQGGGPTYEWKRVQTIAAAGTRAVQKKETSTVRVYTASQLDVPTIRSTVQSNIKRPVIKAITHSFLLLEKDALVNLTTVQIADYSAMRSYIETRNRTTGPSPQPSILALFDNPKTDESAPNSISEMDMLLLDSLYSSPSDVSAFNQRAAVLHRISRELKARSDE